MKNHENVYSPSEIALIESLSPHWAKIIKTSDINPCDLYKILSLDCFILKKEGVNVDSLRNMMDAIQKCHPYRMTEEFDALCKIE